MRKMSSKRETLHGIYPDERPTSPLKKRLGDLRGTDGDILGDDEYVDVKLERVHKSKRKKRKPRGTIAKPTSSQLIDTDFSQICSPTEAPDDGLVGSFIDDRGKTITIKFLCDSSIFFSVRKG